MKAMMENAGKRGGNYSGFNKRELMGTIPDITKLFLTYWTNIRYISNLYIMILSLHITTYNIYLF